MSSSLSAASPDEIAAWCDEIMPKDGGRDYQVEARVGEHRISVAPTGARPAQCCGCIQDMFLSALALTLSGSGKLDLAANVGAYLPELNRGTKPGMTIRVGDLMCHSSGQHPPPPDRAADVYAGWNSLVDYLTARPSRFPPGEVVDQALIERLLLSRILGELLGKDPQEVVLRRYFDGHEAYFKANDAGLPELFADMSGLLEAGERLLADPASLRGPAAAIPGLGSAQIFLPDRVSKGSVPLSVSFGMLGFGNGLWGQNGRASDGSCAIRFDEGRGWMLAGAFSNKHLRDSVLNEICHRLGGSSGADPKTRRIGYLNGFAPEDLAGAYDCGTRGELDVEFDGAVLSLVFRAMGGKFQCTVLDDGGLRSAFPWPSLWIEPFIHPVHGRICIMIGPAPAVPIDTVP